MYELEKEKFSIPEGFQIKGFMRGGLEVVRPDGLTVFLSEQDDERLNKFRLFGKKEDVILAVGIFRGIQIAENYKEKHAQEVKRDYMKLVDILFGGKFLEGVSL